MHHMEWFSKWAANFNGDFSGDVIFISPDGTEHAIPFVHVASVVAEKIRRDRIAALEQADEGDLLK